MIRVSSVPLPSFYPLIGLVEVTLDCTEILNLGTVAVSVIPEWTASSDDQLLPSRAIASCNNQLYRVTYDPRASGDDALIQMIWLTDFKRSGLRQPEMRAIAQLDPRNSCGIPSSLWRRLYCMDNENIYATELEVTLDTRVIPRRIGVRGTPTRIIYLSNFDKLIVAVAVPFFLETQRKKLVFSMLKIVDPNSPGLPEETADDLEAGTFNNPVASDPSTVVVGKSGERILAITLWSIRTSGHTWRMLVVGTMGTRGDSETRCGRVYIYNISPDVDGVLKLTLKYTKKTADPVYSLAAYDETSICCCSGNVLTMFSLFESEGAFTIREEATHPLRSPGRNIEVHVPYIYITTAKESLGVFEIKNPRTIALAFNDQQARDGMNHLCIQDQESSLVLASDRAGSVRGLWQPPFATVDGALQCVFEAKLSGSITCLSMASIQERPSTGPVEDKKAIIGSTLDGAFYRFDLLDENQWRLLRWIQNIAEKDVLVCPHQSRESKNRHIEPARNHKRDMHVNGDILARVLHYGGSESVEFLRDLVERDRYVADDPVDYSNAEERRKRFAELAQAVVGKVEGRVLFERVVLHLKYMLHATI